MDKKIINIIFILFMFFSGGINKLRNIDGTSSYLEKKINSTNVNSVFIISLIATIVYFNLNIGKNKMLAGLTTLSFISILVLTYLKNDMFKPLYRLIIIGVILLLTLGSGIILYSAYTDQYKIYAYVSCVLLAVFTAMTILIFHFPTDPKEIIPFMKNLSITGGLMLLSTKFE